MKLFSTRFSFSDCITRKESESIIDIEHLKPAKCDAATQTESVLSAEEDFMTASSTLKSDIAPRFSMILENEDQIKLPDWSGIFVISPQDIPELPEDEWTSGM